MVCERGYKKTRIQCISIFPVHLISLTETAMRFYK